MSIDKRKFPRVNISCKISTVYGERLLVFNTHTENMGSGGMMTILEEKLHISTIVDVELLLPDREKPLKCTGKVAWVAEMNPKELKPHLFNTGIEFIDMAEFDNVYIRKFVDALLVSQG